MRKLIIASIVAAGAALSFAAPSVAGGYYGGGYYGGGYDNVDHYYGHKRHYKRSYYEPHCWIKKIRKYDYYGNLVVKRIRVCN
ncbi:hypothetical protein [Rhizobium herbae]|uniref:Sulfur globule protein n=1 Tax=Rhizobium herbae TaxID=508661 RepID=A0ABS4EJC9_9HYPH|nr:hypothetical protein [Rhizobium herbae]MBP1857931.1 hypothetical protein [Rhizobium herbae]